MITEYTQLILRKPQRAMGSPNAVDAWCDEAATAIRQLEADNAALRLERDTLYRVARLNGVMAIDIQNAIDAAKCDAALLAGKELK